MSNDYSHLIQSSGFHNQDVSIDTVSGETTQNVQSQKPVAIKHHFLEKLKNSFRTSLNNRSQQTKLRSVTVTKTTKFGTKEFKLSKPPKPHKTYQDICKFLGMDWKNFSLLPIHEQTCILVAGGFKELESPLDTLNLETQKEILTSCQNEVGKIKASISSEYRSLVEGLESTIQVRLDSIDRESEMYFSKDGLQGYQDIYQGVLNTIFQRLQPFNFIPNVDISVVKNSLYAVQDQIKNLNERAQSSTTFNQEDFLKTAQEMESLTRNAFNTVSGFLKEQGGVPMPPYDQAFVQALDYRPNAWVKFEKDIQLLDSKNNPFKARLSLIPQNMILPEFLKPGQTGHSSLNRKSENVINAWNSNVSVPAPTVRDPDNHKTISSILRTGSTRGAEPASKQILLMAALNQNQVSLEGLKRLPQPITLHYSNVQLMTPGSKLFGGMSDKSMPFDQMDTFKRLANGPQPIKIDIPGGKPIEINLEKPLLFNFASNFQATNPVIKKLCASQLRENHRRNAESMQALFGNSLNSTESNLATGSGVLANFLKRTDISAKDKAVVEVLAEQVRSLWISERYKSDNSDPYAIQSRLLLLLEKIDYAPSYNCKSGKDRTGICCMEIEKLAIGIEMLTRDVPEGNYQAIQKMKEDLHETFKPFKELGTRAKTNNYAIYSAGTGIHISRACIGIGGLRVENPHNWYSAPFERWGNLSGEFKASAKGESAKA